MKKIVILIVSTLMLGAGTIPFQVNSTTNATLQRDHNSIYVTVKDKKQKLLSIEPALLERTLQMGENTLYEIKDFNFDGNKDIAVKNGNIGYGGVNIYKDYFFYDPDTHEFQLAGRDINELHIEGNKLVAYTKDGPLSYLEVYDITQKKLYLRSSTIDVGFLQRTTHYTPGGKSAKTTFTPDTLTITAPKAYFYTHPDENTKTKVYVIKGDKVKVLDYKPFEGWLYIAYQSPKKLFKRWIKQENVE